MTINKKYSNFINSISYYKALLKPNNKKYFDEIASLYINRKIEKKTTVNKLLDKLVSRGSGPKSAVKLIEKYSTYEPVKGIKEASPETIKRNIELYSKLYHIRLTYTLQVTKKIPIKSVTVRDVNTGKVIRAMTFYEALEILKDETKQQHELDNEYYKNEIIKFLTLNIVFKIKNLILM